MLAKELRGLLREMIGWTSSAIIVASFGWTAWLIVSLVMVTISLGLLAWVVTESK